MNDLKIRGVDGAYQTFQKDFRFYVDTWVKRRYLKQSGIEYSYQLADAMQDILTNPVPSEDPTTFSIIYAEGQRKTYHFVYYNYEFYHFNFGIINISQYGIPCLETLFKIMTGEALRIIKRTYFKLVGENELWRRLNNLSRSCDKLLPRCRSESVTPPLTPSSPATPIMLLAHTAELVSKPIAIKAFPAKQ
jgi:hypothetical protein